MTLSCRSLILAALVGHASGQAAKAVAKIQASKGTGLTVSGTVTFEQSAELGDMTVITRHSEGSNQPSTFAFPCMRAVAVAVRGSIRALPRQRPQETPSCASDH